MCNIMIGIVAKKDFFDEGVERQLKAWNIHNAEKQFENSCRLCVMMRKRMACEECPIKRAFELKLEMEKHRNPTYYKEARKFFIDEEP